MHKWYIRNVRPGPRGLRCDLAVFLSKRTEADFQALGPFLFGFLFGMVACEGSVIARPFLPVGDRCSQHRVGRNDGYLFGFMWAGLHNPN
jgi:hypothetical protein